MTNQEFIAAKEKLEIVSLCLIGPQPDQEARAQLSSRITNELPISRMTIELARRA